LSEFNILGLRRNIYDENDIIVGYEIYASSYMIHYDFKRLIDACKS